MLPIQDILFLTDWVLLTFCVCGLDWPSVLNLIKSALVGQGFPLCVPLPPIYSCLSPSPLCASCASHLHELTLILGATHSFWLQPTNLICSCSFPALLCSTPELLLLLLQNTSFNLEADFIQDICLAFLLLFASPSLLPRPNGSYHISKTMAAAGRATKAHICSLHTMCTFVHIVHLTSVYLVFFKYLVHTD